MVGPPKKSSQFDPFDPFGDIPRGGMPWEDEEPTIYDDKTRAHDKTRLKKVNRLTPEEVATEKLSQIGRAQLEAMRELYPPELTQDEIRAATAPSLNPSKPARYSERCAKCSHPRELHKEDEKAKASGLAPFLKCTFEGCSCSQKPHKAVFVSNNEAGSVEQLKKSKEAEKAGKVLCGCGHERSKHRSDRACLDCSCWFYAEAFTMKRDDPSVKKITCYFHAGDKKASCACQW